MMKWVSTNVIFLIATPLPLVSDIMYESSENFVSAGGPQVMVKLVGAEGGPDRMFIEISHYFGTSCKPCTDRKAGELNTTAVLLL